MQRIPKRSFPIELRKWEHASRGYNRVAQLRYRVYKPRYRTRYQTVSVRVTSVDPRAQDTVSTADQAALYNAGS